MKSTPPVCASRSTKSIPALDFLKLAREAGVPLVINSDAHAPEQVGMDFDAARALAREAGYTTSLRFQGRHRTEAPL